MPDLKKIYEWMIADADSDGVANADELASGRNPFVSEVAMLKASAFLILD